MLDRVIRRTLVRPADLKRVDFDPDLAKVLGYVPKPKEKPADLDVKASGNEAEKDPPREPNYELIKGDLAPAAFLVPSGFRALAAPRTVKGTEEFVPEWSNPPAPLPFLPLASAARLRRLVARFDADQRRSRQVHIPAAVRRLARVQPLAPIPRLARPAPAGLQLIADRSRHLAPFWADQRVAFAMLHDQAEQLWMFDALVDKLRNLRTDTCARPKPDDGPLLVLSDLGALAGADMRRFWRTLGQEFRRRGGRLLALVPCAVERLPADLATLWSATPWEPRSRPDQENHLDEQVEDLLALCAPVARLEPALMRAIRRHCTDAGPEAEVRLWQHAAIASPHVAAATFKPEEIRAYKDKFNHFARQKNPKAQAVWNLIRQGRVETGYEFLFEEIGALPEDVRDALVSKGDQEDATRFWSTIAAAATDGTLQTRAQRWLAEAGYRNPPGGELWKDGTASREAFAATADFAQSGAAQRTTIAQAGGDLVLSAAPAGSLVGTLDQTSDLISCRKADPLAFYTEAAQGPQAFHDRLRDGRLGPQMIVLPLGEFLMGSPESEEDRLKNEGPQVSIKIETPVALGATPVTFAEFDAFCEATGREKPEDEGWGRGQRPVINVRQEDAKAYCAWLSQETGWNYHLPSEAHWEYACRAGTTTSYSWGSDWDKSRANAEGTDKTLEVAAYDPNPWGLYDMHGNVWEWCADAWQESHEGAQRDGSPRQASEQQADRVVRGGSWFFPAWYCRSAARFRILPGYRNAFLGFRLARGQGAPAGRAERAGTGGAAASPAPGRSLDLRVQPERQTKRQPLRDLPTTPFLITSNRAAIFLDWLRPDHLPWASALGRDPHGLWADVEVKNLRQRFRYCPPGQFFMGSPEDEEGWRDSEGPQTSIIFNQGFWLMDTPVTQELYEGLMGENPSIFVSPTRPVENVSYDKAQAFVENLNSLVPGLSTHLPSEAQWEYACRAGTTTRYSWGHEWDESHANGDRARETSEVRSYDPNPWGLYDMHGNVREWCADAWHDSHAGAQGDGSPRQAKDKKTARVVRGGSWYDAAGLCRSAARYWGHPGDRSVNLGFRLARGQGAPAGRAERAGKGRAAARPARVRST